MSLTKIGDIAIELMQKHNENYVGIENFGFTQEVFEEALKRKVTKPFSGGLKSHPLNKFQRVLNALDRDERFEKHYLNLHLGVSERATRTRLFCLKEAENEQKNQAD